ncbi:MAG: SdpI family protein [Nanoarchaeota archaeon]
MKITKPELKSMLVIILLFGFSLYLYNKVPLRIPIHWDLNGEADAYSARAARLFLIPICALIVYIILTAVPKIEIFRRSLTSFKKKYENIKIILIVFFVLIYTATIVHIFYPFNIYYVVAPAILALLYYIGYSVQFIQRNYFIGIKTPWTLDSGYVWKKTHELGSLLFRGIAVAMGGLIFLPEYFWMSLIILFVLAVICLFVYSYVLHKNRI